MTLSQGCSTFDFGLKSLIKNGHSCKLIIAEINSSILLIYNFGTKTNYRLNLQNNEHRE